MAVRHNRKGLLVRCIFCLICLSNMSQSILFEDIFEIKNLNENGKKFERGSPFRSPNNPLVALTSTTFFVGLFHSEPSPLQGHHI